MRHKELPGNDEPDIFEISIGSSCVNDDDLRDKTKDSTDTSKNNMSYGTISKSSLPVFNEDEDSNYLEKIFVDDKNGDYVYQQNLAIFNNKYFNDRNVIAPGVSSTYNFKVHNNTTMKIKYKIEMYEATDYTINLMYRLKRNGEYIIGNGNSWVSADNIKSDYMNLDAKRYDNYSLDWKWSYDGDHDDEDTMAGENMINFYKLNVRFYFEQV